MLTIQSRLVVWPPWQDDVKSPAAPTTIYRNTLTTQLTEII